MSVSRLTRRRKPRSRARGHMQTSSPSGASPTQASPCAYTCIRQSRKLTTDPRVHVETNYVQLSATQTRPVRKNSQSLRMFMRLLCCGSAIWLSNKSVCRLWQDSHPGFATLSCCCWRGCIPGCRPLLDVAAAEWADPPYAPACA